VTGAAVGTTIGRGCGVLFAAWNLFRPGGRIHVSRESWKLDPTLLWKLLRLSGPGFPASCCNGELDALMPIMAGFGDVAIAGYVIALRVVMFALLPALGLSNAAATMVGQNLGADKPERSEGAVWTAAKFNAVLYFAVGVVFWLFSSQIIGIFTHEPRSCAMDECAPHHRLRIYVLRFGHGARDAFNGAGDTWTRPT
jgi:Na+-driven multidrug efflux pump